MATTADYELGPHTYPRGWLMVAASAAVTATPGEARFFGEDVVLYRGAGGRAHMVEAYCPHMGAHLAVGPMGATAEHGVQIEGDDIRCPNHGWRFGPDGRCNQIPYSPMRIPPTLGLRTWRLQEAAGCVFAWHDPEEGEPAYDLPEVPEWGDRRWICGPVDEMGEIDVHQLELAEHGVDKIHIANVHGADRIVGHRVTFDGHRAQTSSTTSQRLPDGSEYRSTSHARYFGPAFLLAEVEGERPMILLFCHTPVHDGRVRGWHTVMMRAKGDLPTEEDHAVYELARAGSLKAFQQDIEIFKRKKPTLRAVQIPGDPPFRAYRRWYAQFYAPRAETAAIQAGANGVFVTEGDHDAPWIGSAA